MAYPNTSGWPDVQCQRCGSLMRALGGPNSTLPCYACPCTVVTRSMDVTCNHGVSIYEPCADCERENMP